MISRTVIYHFTPYFPSCSNCTLLFVANSNNETNRSFVNSFKRTSIAQFVACTRSFYTQRNIIENNYDRKVCMTFCKSVSKNQKFHFSMINRFCTHSRAGRNTLYKAHKAIAFVDTLWINQINSIAFLVFLSFFRTLSNTFSQKSALLLQTHSWSTYSLLLKRNCFSFENNWKTL